MSIAQKIGRLFESVGATVVYTRTNDGALCKNGFNKMEDMSNRALIIEKAKPYIAISVHSPFPQERLSLIYNLKKEKLLICTQTVKTRNWLVSISKQERK